MSEIDATSPTTAATNVDTSENDNVRDAVAPERKLIGSPNGGGMEAEETTADPNVAAENADSEAETLIESPEKRKAAAILNAEPDVKAEVPDTVEDVVDRVIRPEPDLPSGDGKNRKRKRPDIDGADGSRRVPSAPSSILSSPSPDELQSEFSDPITRKARSPGNSFKRQSSDRPEGSWDQEQKRRDKPDGQIKIKKRRPSDVLTHDQKPQSAKQRQTSDNPERRETRSATYPRHSSEDRSPSPRPSPRSHKRGQSTQLTNAPSNANKSKRIPPPLTTRKRNRSEDRHSVSTEASGSPGPSVPNLRKFASIDHEAISPAKQPMASVWSRRNRDQNGRTRLAKACADNKLDVARQRFEERPEDLNIADNAGNTPLQIASLEGFVDIVGFLLSKSCEVDSKNIDKDTPLIDAVENGHLEVVQLLLGHGANPRMGNAKGDEPYELVPADDENYGAIRALLANARAKDVKRRRSDEQIVQGSAIARSSSRAASAASPRDSPPIFTPRSPPPSLMSRRRTGRSEQTRNDLLWQANTQENLQKLAAKGDSEGIVSVLSILEKAEPGALISAARGGHDQALEFLIAMGKPDPDPQPIRSGDFKPGYNTPMLAAIGRGNTKVIELLLAQTGFNPRKRDGKGRSYPEISKERKGERWEEEHALLKEAYDRNASPQARKHESPKKIRDREKENRIPSSSPSRSQRKAPRSPGTTHKDSHETKRDRELSEHKAPKVKDRERSSSDSPEHRKTHRTRRSQTDLPTLITDGELQKRRRLLSSKAFHERRPSQASHASSDNEAAEKNNLRKELKKETSILKRARDSRTPERQPSPESEASRDMQKKRRRVVSDSSPEEARRELSKERPNNPSSESTMKMEAIPPEVVVKENAAADDVLMTDPPASTDEKLPEPDSSLVDDKAEERAAEAAAAAQEEEQKRAEESERLAREEAERKQKEEEEARIESERLATEAAEAARLKAEEEAIAAEEKRKAEIAAAEQRRHEAEAQRKREEEERAERQRKEEEERAERQRKEEERQRRMEERRRREAEELERIRREALPALLCTTAKMIEAGDPTVRDHTWLKRYLPLYTVHTRQLVPDCTNDTAQEQWIPNFQAAGLLAAKDLYLRQYTQLEKRPVNAREKLHLWKVAGVMLATDYDANAFNTTTEREWKSYKDSEAKFSNMDALFWVRVSFSPPPPNSACHLLKQKLILLSL